VEHTVTDDQLYQVVRNDAGQYSIWPHDRHPPAGWHDAGFTGTEEECAAHVERVWTDLTPSGLRRRAS
jgi:MbtH protein